MTAEPPPSTAPPDGEGGFAGRPGFALVTGGSGAIGAAVSRVLAEQGADIAMTYRGNEAAARRVAEELEALGTTVLVRHMATEDDAQVAQVVGEVAAAGGGIHTLVTAAAPTASQRWLSQLDRARFGAQIEQDLGGFFSLVSATLPHLREARGSIVAITTVANRRYVLRDVLSTAPKGAVEAVVRAVAAEEARFGVRANSVGVGILDEGMAAALMGSGDIREKDMAHARSVIPLKAFGTARDIAEVTAFLAGPRAGYITGQWIDVDGGYSL